MDSKIHGTFRVSGERVGLSYGINLSGLCDNENVPSLAVKTLDQVRHISYSPATTASKKATASRYVGPLGA